MATLDYVCFKMRGYMDEVTVPAVQEFGESVAEYAAGTPANDFAKGMCCGFLTGMQLALTMLESGRSLGKEQTMSLLLDAMELGTAVG